MRRSIDLTGKSPNPIEDINFQGRGIGRFPLPAGDELVGGTIDVYRAALAAENPGAVAPLTPAEQGQTSDKPSILERAVLEAQRRGGQTDKRRVKPLNEEVPRQGDALGSDQAPGAARTTAVAAALLPWAGL